MPRQHDLFGSAKLALNPAPGSSEPRLWVRRLAIWNEPGGELIRDVSLRPGLNIIWSPDGTDDSEAAEGERSIGHGSGKTLFCRLLRYCLGEQRFADEEQRERISTNFPNGIVGAEIMLDGVCWAVVRPLGLRRRHVAAADGNLDEIAAGEGAATGIEPLIDAIEQKIVTPGVASLIRAQPGQRAWPVALAWLTRDQECRFDDVLDWRSPASGSDAPLPASGREARPRREALRAFLSAITEDEQRVRQDEEQLRTEIQDAETDASHLSWDVKRRVKTLVKALDLQDRSLPDMPLLIDVLRQTADGRLAEAAQLPPGDTTELATARQALAHAEAQLQSLKDEATALEAVTPLEQRILASLRSEVPGLTAAAVTAANPVCPVCEVPIERALADGCRISLKQHDQQACRARLDLKRQEVDEQDAKVQALQMRAESLLPDLAIASQTVEAAKKRVKAIEDVQEARSTAWLSARSLKVGVQDLAEAAAAQNAALECLRKREDSIAAVREQLGVFRDKQSIVFARLSEKFDPIVQRLVGPEAKGSVTLTGVGLNLKIDIGGDRRTAAIESLKVLAFDLACLCLSVEGATRIPAFFIHDSPREADLGLSIYDEIFRMAREIEALTELPLFQYIVTTTTRPPVDVGCLPWLRLTLRGSPGSARLLGKNL